MMLVIFDTKTLEFLAIRVWTLMEVSLSQIKIVIHPFISGVTLGKPLNLSEPLFSHL